MKKSKYYLKKVGLPYFIICFLDRLLYTRDNALAHSIMRLRGKQVQKYLEQKYAYVIERNKSIENKKGVIEKNSPIWVCWWQGENEMPEIARACLKSIKCHAANHPVKFISRDNIEEYLNVPEFFYKKLEKKQIGIAVFSDWIRTSLLSQYGGIWLDITTFVLDDIDFWLGDKSFYTVKHQLYSEYHVCRGKWHDAYLASAKGDAVTTFVADLLTEYYKNEQYSIYYLLIDCVIGCGYDNIPTIRKEIDDVPVNNRKLLELQKVLNESYTENNFCCSKDNLINKLSYKGKLDKVDSAGRITNYGHIISMYQG